MVKKRVGLARREDNWDSGDRYEPFMGRWSRPIARGFLSWLAAPEEVDWLDVGCGTGALTEAILEQANPRSVLAIDPSPGFIKFARARLPSPRLAFKIGDAISLEEADNSQDVAASGLALNFMPQPKRALQEMRRVVRPGGLAAAYVWDYAGKMELLRYFWDAAAALDPEAQELDEGRRFPLCQPKPLAALFRQAGLDEVEVSPIEAATTFGDFDDYWTPFLGGQGPAPSYTMSLSEADRAALRVRIRSELPVSEDGSIQLMARAWAARGRKA
jgi:SAM-dependent methyltransferase